MQGISLKTLADARIATAVRNKVYVAELNTKIIDLEKEQTALGSALEKRIDAMVKIEKKYKQILDDKEKLRQRIMAMRMKTVLSTSQKLCKNCSQEYAEGENFNWSCRTHRVRLQPA